jgi:light-regulated signal transduction histidine kinase (bacteriophytochrome)
VVTGNADQLAHVFQNLLTNALKYCKPDVSPKIQIGAKRHEDEWNVSVTDNGIGFAQEYADLVFGLFKRLHNTDQHDGTGIGLAICRRIIERYGGKIWAESQLGVGSAFCFSLPKP